MSPLLVLRVHSDIRLGLGHVARALALSEAWRALGGTPLLAISGDDRARKVGAGIHPLTGEALGIECVDLGLSPGAVLPEAIKDRAAVVLLDQWDHTQAMIESLRPLKVAVMEDDGDAHEGADLLFQPFLEGLAWPATPLRNEGGRKVKPCETRRGGCRVLRGAPYVVVSPAAVKARPKREPLQPLAVHRLLVTFGGTDGPGLAQRAFDILAELLRTGAWSGTCTLLAPNGIQGAPVPGLRVEPSLPDLTGRITSYDAIWCAAGVTLAEAVCLGVPAAAWAQNERQGAMISDLAQAGGCFSLGVGPEADLRGVREALLHWLGPEGQDTRQEQTRDGMGLLDGLGAHRIAQELWALAGH